jgi:hypothetical protein
MATVEKPLVELVAGLPPELQAQVRNYVTQLLTTHDAGTGTPLRQTWAGALRDLRDQTTSVELQHQATAWMAEHALKRGERDVPR